METPVYFAGIHTMQVRTSTNPEKRFEHQLKPYVKEYKMVNGVGVYQLNPNKYDEQGFLKSFSAFLETMKKIFEELELTDFIIERIDFSLNTVTEYDEIFKLNLFLYYLNALYREATNCYITKGWDFLNRSMKFKKKNISFEIYNKNIQSFGKDEANTRIEFRYTDSKGLDPYETVKQVIYDLEQLPNYIPEANKFLIGLLHTQYEKELTAKDGNITNLTQFVKKYCDTLLNYEIAKGVYSFFRNSKFSWWYYRHVERGHKLVLYKNIEIKRYIKALKGTTLNYLKE